MTQATLDVARTTSTRTKRVGLDADVLDPDEMAHEIYQLKKRAVADQQASKVLRTENAGLVKHARHLRSSVAPHVVPLSCLFTWWRQLVSRGGVSWFHMLARGVKAFCRCFSTSSAVFRAVYPANTNE
jgi:hypothetical protein